MSNYKQALEKAKKSGQAKNLTPEFIKFDKKGDVVVGKCLSVQQVASAEGGQPYNQYIFDTDEGVIKFHLGNNADKEFASSLIPGSVLSIEFQGQVDVGHGRRVNKFQIFQIVEPEQPEPPETKPDKSGDTLDKK